MKRRVLFVGAANGSRSQMAEAMVNAFHADKVQAMSAGYEAGPLNPLAVKAMAEIGIDISGAATKTVFEVYKRGIKFHHIVSMCDTDKCRESPIFPQHKDYERWHLDNPDEAAGSEEERMAVVRRVRDELRSMLDFWTEVLSEGRFLGEGLVK